MNAKNIIAEYDVPSTGLWAALVFVVSLNLRPAIAAVGPLLTQIGADLSWGEGVQGVLTAIPLLAFAAVSPLVTFIERRVGVDIAILSALLCIAVGNFIRSYCGNVGIWLGTVIFASSIAVQRAGAGDRKTRLCRSYCDGYGCLLRLYHRRCRHCGIDFRSTCAGMVRLACLTCRLERAAASGRGIVGVAHTA